MCVLRAISESSLSTDKQIHVNMLRGACLRRMGKYGEAADSLEAALQKQDPTENKKSSLVHIYVGDAACSQGQSTRALQHYGLGSPAQGPLRGDLHEAGWQAPGTDTLVRVARNVLPDNVHALLRAGFKAGSGFWHAYNPSSSFSYRLSSPPSSAIEVALQHMRPPEAENATYAEWWPLTLDPHC